MINDEVTPTDVPTNPIVDALASIRHQRAELAARKQRRVDAQNGPEQLAAETLALQNEQAIEAAEIEHGAEKIRVVDTPKGVIIVKRAHAASYKMFMDKQTTKVDDCEKLARRCVVYPTLDEVDKIADEYASTWLRLAGAITKLAGHRADEVSEK